MQVQVELSRRDGAGGPGRPWTFIGFAVFVLVARTPDHTAGAQVPPLVPRTARERELFECGKVRWVVLQCAAQRLKACTALGAWTGRRDVVEPGLGNTSAFLRT